ncbi:MAG: hypothetical protein MJZ16_06615 [Bacteroidales bacterium]|nr:hypothetical protein [Bacteroidales bacterium]
MEKVKIVLDADVIIHFSKANRLSILPSILPEYDHIVLSTVYNELISIQQQIDNQVIFLKNLSVEEFNPTGDMRREYAVLSSRFGKGESACMAYCRFTNNVIGSSNLKDVKEYCTKQKITYLTTLDFLYYAYVRNIMSKEECDQFMQDVTSGGSKLPTVDIATYTPNSHL